MRVQGHRVFFTASFLCLSALRVRRPWGISFGSFSVCILLIHFPCLAGWDWSWGCTAVMQLPCLRLVNYFSLYLLCYSFCNIHYAPFTLWRAAVPQSQQYCQHRFQNSDYQCIHRLLDTNLHLIHHWYDHPGTASCTKIAVLPLHSHWLTYKGTMAITIDMT